jgi:hypothetical protein
MSCPRPAFQLSLGLAVRLSKYLAASRGFRVSREGDGLAGAGSPLSLGGYSHVMSCPLPQLGLWLHVPLSRLAMGGGGGPLLALANLSQEILAATSTGGSLSKDGPGLGGR